MAKRDKKEVRESDAQETPEQKEVSDALKRMAEGAEGKAEGKSYEISTRSFRFVFGSEIPRKIAEKIVQSYLDRELRTEPSEEEIKREQRYGEEAVKEFKSRYNDFRARDCRTYIDHTLIGSSSDRTPANRPYAIISGAMTPKQVNQGRVEKGYDKWIDCKDLAARAILSIIPDQEEAIRQYLDGKGGKIAKIFYKSGLVNSKTGLVEPSLKIVYKSGEEKVFDNMKMRNTPIAIDYLLDQYYDDFSDKERKSYESIKYAEVQDETDPDDPNVIHMTMKMRKPIK